MTISELKYNIASGELVGSIGDASISCLAGSGGRAGSHTKDAENWFLKNNALATHVHHGLNASGPIPQGRYWMRPHEKKANIVRLDPFPENLMFNRSGMEIHGRGPKGSEGCIVPYKFEDVVKIYNAVTKFLSLTKSHPVLIVIAVGSDIDRKFNSA